MTDGEDVESSDDSEDDDAEDNELSGVQSEGASEDSDSDGEWVPAQDVKLTPSSPSKPQRSTVKQSTSRSTVSGLQTRMKVLSLYADEDEDEDE